MIGNFFGDFGDFFDPLYQNWVRPFKEKDGYKVYPDPKHNGFLIVFNTLGLSESDIKVTHRQEESSRNSIRLKVCGSAKLADVADNEYSANYEIIFKNADDIESVQYKVKNGLTIVYIKTKKQKYLSPEEETAKNIAEGDEFDW